MAAATASVPDVMHHLKVFVAGSSARKQYFHILYNIENSMRYSPIVYCNWWTAVSIIYLAAFFRFIVSCTYSSESRSCCFYPQCLVDTHYGGAKPSLEH
jgi:hypothetical protein